MSNLTPDPDLTPSPSPKGEGSFMGEGSRNLKFILLNLLN